MDKFDITIVGAGVVGLSIAAELADEKRSLLVLEKNSKFGQETSSRNSEVIHAGIYYPEGSLKAKFCVEGKELLYKICRDCNIPHKNCGKLIIAVKEDEIKSLEGLKVKAEKNGVTDLTFLERKDIKKVEPHINAVCGLYSPSTGIIDSHSLMVYLLNKAQARGVVFSFSTPLTGLSRNKDGWICEILDTDGKKFTFFSRIIINSAGLFSDHIAGMAGINDYKLYMCKGEYFSVINGKDKLVKSLVYPSPAHDMVSLGIHTVVDLGGGLKLGPNAFYTDMPDYNVDKDHRDDFYDSCKPFLPFLEKEDLVPDMAGIRPKLQGPGETVKDFIIKAEKGDFEGLINLIGIESPGLTSSPAIARYVVKLLEEFL